MKTARRQAREAALQALYAWQVSGGDALEQMKALEGHERADLAFAQAIVRGVSGRSSELEEMIRPHLDRPLEKLSPVERAILYIGSYELAAHPETPFKVVLNEAVELGKSFGGTEGHRFVNGVLEKVAGAVRPDEVARGRKIA
ncbi:MAG TPA: transcription antitermination factor NusB [Burkholderiales bacterium]|jgi:N utilization substance protein B|nr:transcription antitermination factor NusB [Burkholderiales bacterium]